MLPRTATTAADAPFTAAELERLLRPYDIDATSLPDRLRSIVDPTNTYLLRNLLTTDSYDLPSPNILPTRDLINAANTASLPMVSLNFVDMLKIRMQGVYTGSNLALEIQKMLPPEVIAGQRFDLNRPFGNGRDDNNNYVVDEPGESETVIWQSTSNAPTSFQSAAPNLTNGMAVSPSGGTTANDYLLARHLFARHLYVMMMVLKDSGATLLIDGEGGIAGPSPSEETARAIAQWAVNVVDFRDPRFDHDAVRIRREPIQRLER